MKTKDSGKHAVELKKSDNTTQIKVVVEDYAVKLNFQSMSVITAISNIKHMMLGGAVKT